jgi:ferredoxin
MKVHIDQDGCIECGLCASTCPEVFVLNVSEKASIVECRQNGSAHIGEVGEPLRSCVEEAAASFFFFYIFLVGYFLLVIFS